MPQGEVVQEVYCADNVCGSTHYFVPLCVKHQKSLGKNKTKQLLKFHWLHLIVSVWRQGKILIKHEICFIFLKIKGAKNPSIIKALSLQKLLSLM